MTVTTDLVRPEIRRMQPYRNAEFVDGMVRLNANENPWRPPGDDTGPGLNRYPEPRPFALGSALASHYGVDAGELLVTRGSSEAIDVVIRAFCRPGIDEIVICPPTFGMYETYAQIQGAAVRRVPLLKHKGYALDAATILGEWSPTNRVLFVCSPNNPTGNPIPADTIAALAVALRGRGVVVVDAAYVEFADDDPTRELLAASDNLIVLRTLSKAMALAGIRCGALLAARDVTGMLSCVLPPYAFPTVCSEAVRICLHSAHATTWRGRVSELRAERIRLGAALARIPGITRVWPSAANFVLVESDRSASLVAAAKAGGVLVRDFSWDPWLPGCVRITVGDRAQNDQLLKALA